MSSDTSLREFEVHKVTLFSEPKLKIDGKKQ